MTREEIKQVKMTNQEAIEILRDTPIDLRSPREDDIHTLYAKAQMMAIKALQERPKGRWVLGSELDDVDYEHFLYCSNCHEEAYWDTDYGQQTFDFCPNCGADMRESEQE